MSLQAINNTIEHFHTSHTNEVLILNGKWGVGKTFYWRELIKTASQIGSLKNPEDKIEFSKNHYAYISIFGIESLAALKEKIVIETIFVKDVNSSFNKFNSWANKFGTSVEKFPALKNLTGGMVSALAFDDVRETIICFDDLERKSKNLDLNDVLGLVNYLREERDCKIVLILNEDQFENPADKEILRKYTEKIAERQIVFAPSPGESFNYIFPSTYARYEIIRNHCLILHIKNIRILKRIRSALEELDPYISETEISVTKNIIASIILFVWAIYDKESNPPALEFIKEFNFLSVDLKKSFLKQEISDEEERQQRILEDYGYHFTDDLDNSLISYLQNGYLPKAFKHELKVKNDAAIAQSGTSTFEVVMIKVRDSFQSNEAEIIRDIKECFEKNSSYLNLGQLQVAVDVLSKLKEKTLASKLIENFPYENFTRENLQFALNPQYSNVMNQKIIQKIKLQLDQKIDRPKLSLTEITEKIRFEQYSSEESFEDLLSNSEDDFYTFFKNYHGEDFALRVRKCLQYAENPSFQDNLKLKQKIHKVFRRIARESDLNKIRVTKRWGINLKNISGSDSGN